MTTTEATAPPAFVPSTSDLTVHGADLAAVIRDVLPFTNDWRDADVPQLCAVLLSASGGTMSATATDRYTLAHSRVPGVGTLPEKGLLLRRADADLIAQMFTGSYGEVTITVTDLGDVNRARFAGKSIGDVDPTDYTEADQADYFGTPVEFTVQTLKEKFPLNWVDLFGVEKEPGGITGGVGLSPKLLARYEQVSERRAGTPLRLYTYGDAASALRVEIGDDFAAVHMPVRIDADNPARLAPVVPIGHSQPEQDQPAAA